MKIYKLPNDYIITQYDDFDHAYISNNGQPISCNQTVLQEIIKMRELLQRINEVGFLDSYECDEALGDISNYINSLPK